MKKLIAAVCLGALAFSAATTAKAQIARQVTPIEALFGALLGAPVAAMPARDSARRPGQFARQGYRPGLRGPRNAAFAARRTERRDFLWPRANLQAPVTSRRPARAAIPKAIDRRYLKQTVVYNGDHAPGTIVIDTSERFLYFVQDNGTALRYGIGVGREGFEWNGTAKVKRKAEWPAWHPPAEMRKREPWLPARMEGGENNPLGARAMYLFKGSKDTLYRIHGTNQPGTIGQAVSSGCIRMLNDDVADLYERVPVGTTVVVI